MKISTVLSYAGGFKPAAAQVVELAHAGLDMVWMPEAYGFDSPSHMGYLAALTDGLEIGSAILPVFTRTPSLIAMTAAGLDSLTEGRFHLGLGASGPQVIEGFHGLPYDAPLGRTREVIDICRLVWQRDAPLAYDGQHYTIPLPAGQGTGLGKALKIITHPVRPRIPVWLASLGERNVALTAEVADGWLPHLFWPERASVVWGDALAQGTAARDPSLGPLLVAAGGPLAIGDGPEVVAARELVRPHIALYVGGMGAKGKNFYNDVVRRYGLERQAEEIQDLYLSGQRQQAEAAVPDELVEGLTLCGPASYVAERLAAYAEAGVTHLQVAPVPTAGERPADLIERVRGLAG